MICNWSYSKYTLMYSSGSVEEMQEPSHPEHWTSAIRCGNSINATVSAESKTGEFEASAEVTYC